MRGETYLPNKPAHLVAEADGHRAIAMLDQGPADERGIGRRQCHRLGLGQILGLGHRESAPRIGGAVDQFLPATNRLGPSGDLLLGDPVFLHVGEIIGFLVVIEPAERLLAGRAFAQSENFQRHRFLSSQPSDNVLSV